MCPIKNIQITIPEKDLAVLDLKIKFYLFRNTFLFFILHGVIFQLNHDLTRFRYKLVQKQFDNIY